MGFYAHDVDDYEEKEEKEDEKNLRGGRKPPLKKRGKSPESLIEDEAKKKARARVCHNFRRS